MMRSKPFYIVVIVLYLMSPFFIYRYAVFNAARQEQANIESGIINTSSSAMAEQVNEDDEINQQANELKLEGYGYLGGAVFLVVCPTFMLMFRRRIII